ncbi:MAG: hypothetical protein LOY03_07965, partial [Cyclobacteriaceae bacterium]|nr:hypothetical protein [Cyclobacteriaceae bacterium]
KEHSPLYIGQFLSDLSVPNLENIHTTEMPGLAVFYLAVHPPHNAAVAAGEHFFSFKMSVGIGSKKFLPVAPHIPCAFETATIWWRRGILKDTVLRHGIHNRVYIVTIKGGIKALYSGYGSGSISLLR